MREYSALRSACLSVSSMPPVRLTVSVPDVVDAVEDWVLPFVCVTLLRREFARSPLVMLVTSIIGLIVLSALRQKTKGPPRSSLLGL